MIGENELKVGGWVEFGYSNTPTDRVFHAWHIERKEAHILDIRDYYRDRGEYSHWMKIQDPQPPREQLLTLANGRRMKMVNIMLGIL